MPKNWLSVPHANPKSVASHLSKSGVAIIGIGIAILATVLSWDLIQPLEIMLIVAFASSAIMFQPYPRAAWALYLLTFVAGELLSQADLAPLTLTAPFAAGLITFRNHMSEALLGAAALWYFGIADPITGTGIPSEVVSSAVWAAILLVGIAVGYFFLQARLRYEEREAQWVREMEAQRNELALTLHDSVATALTAVVMRSQALHLRDDVSPEMAEDLKLIASKSRAAMADVRSMLKLMQPDSEPRERGVAPDVRTQLRTMRRTLEEGRFRVHIQRSEVPYLNADGLAALQQVLRELATNINKHAKPRSLVQVWVSSSQMRLSNEIGGAVLPELTSGLGLPAIEQLAKSAGISHSTWVEGNSWITRLEFTKG